MADASHDSRDAFYRSPMGAVPCLSRVTLRLRVDAALEKPRVTLRIWTAGNERNVAMEDVGVSGVWRAFAVEIEAPAEPCLIWYHFKIESAELVFYVGNAWDGMGGSGIVSDKEPPSYQITVYDRRFSPPKWMRDGIMYQIFPDRFYDGYGGKLLESRSDIQVHEDWYETPASLEEGRTGDNLATDFFGGNLKGVEKKLDYLQSLNVNVIYLNPIFRAHSNHKYDIGDYLKIDPTFGDEEDFRSLCAAARMRGIRVVMDGVFSHTGEDSVYFNRYGRYDSIGAYQSEDSPYYSWYKFNKHPDDYVCWWGIPTLPEVDEMHPDFLDFIIRGPDAVIAKWLRVGASGWRLDVADELPDEFISMIRERIQSESSGACLIGEVWEDATNKIAYGQPRTYALGRGLDSVMNYPLRTALIDFLVGNERASKTRRRILSQQENYPRPMYYALMNLMGSHDRVRTINMLAGCDAPDIPKKEMREYEMSAADYALGVSRLKLMSALITALPGMPSVLYGDEAGVQGLKDPFCRKTYPWGREDTDLLAWFRGILAIRRHNPVFRGGESNVFAPHPDVLCVLRTIRGGTDALGSIADDGTAFVAVNRSEETRRVAIDLSLFGVSMLFTQQGAPVDCPGGVLSLSIAPMSSVLLVDKGTQVELQSIVKYE